MRASVTVLLVTIGAAWLLACDSPSGGGGVNCARVPTDPRCRPDTGVMADTTSTTPDGSGGTCTTGGRQCSGDVPEICQNGTWVALAACSASQTCTNGVCLEDASDCCVDMECGTDCGQSCGSCGVGETCSASGTCVSTTCQAQCSGKECGPDGCGGTCGACLADEGCQSGQCVPNATCSCNGAECGLDNCGNACGTCGVGEACEGGVCQGGTPAGDSCSEIVDCIFSDAGCGLIEDEAEFSACADACYAAGSGPAQSEFDAYLTCANDCGADDACFVADCSDDQALCIFDRQGPGTCRDILDCFEGCADGDSACIYGCYEASTTAAQAALVGLNNCLDLACPNATSGDDPCYDTAIAGPCASWVTACQSN